MKNQFSIDISGFAKRANKRVEDVTKGLIFEIGKRVIMRSPVGDPSKWLTPAPEGYMGGRFRNNWHYKFGSSDSATRGSVDSSGSASLQSMNSVFANPASGIHFIYNNLPYSIRLEYGWSGQAPQGMVRLTMLEIDNALRTAL